MTDRVEPSFNRDVESFDVATAISYGGASKGWVKDASSPTQAAADESGITQANFNAFSETSSSSSFDVTIDAGEGFVNGAWVARDASTNVTLTGSTSNQTVYLGYDRSLDDTVTIGKSGDFNSGDPKIPIWDFDTDSNGVTASTDRRQIGRTVDVEHVELVPAADPPSPDSGWVLFVDDDDGDKLKAMDSSGNLTTLAS